MLATWIRQPRPMLEWVGVPLVCLSASLPYISTLHSYFIGDDFGLVYLFSRQEPLHFLRLFTTSWTENVYGTVYDELRPLVALSYQFDYFWGNGDPASFHISNIVFHVINTLLVFAIARRVANLSFTAVILAAIVFAVLPVHAETIAWISGRADSIPALFYVASFACFATWRQSGLARFYFLSLGALFLALFSKQYAITLIATIVAYDMLVVPEDLKLGRKTMAIYAPFIVLIICYLGLRYLLFGNLVRETVIPFGLLLRNGLRVEALNIEVLIAGWPFLEDLDPPIRTALRLGVVAALALAMLPVYTELRHRPERLGPTPRGLALYFGPVWWLISVAPLAATYVSPRHLYLAAFGIAITVGLAFDVLRRTRWPGWRYASAVVGAVVLTGCVLRLQSGVADWNRAASISAKINLDIQSQASLAPFGSLLVLGAPPQAVINPSDSSVFNSELDPPPGRPWLWSWALPYARQPPFVGSDSMQHVVVVEPLSVYCCTGEQWLVQTQATISAWSQEPGRSPVIVLVWDSSTGNLLRQSEQDNPCLRIRALSLIGAGTYKELNRMVGLTLDEVTQASPEFSQANCGDPIATRPA